MKPIAFRSMHMDEIDPLSAYGEEAHIKAVLCGVTFQRTDIVVPHGCRARLDDWVDSRDKGVTYEGNMYRCAIAFCISHGITLGGHDAHERQALRDGG